MRHHSPINSRAPTHRELFVAFFTVGISAFGGALPWARRVVVDDRKWLDDKAFTEILTVCQAIPGPNVINTAVFIGAKFRGISGAVVSFLGLLGAPFAIVLILSQLYHAFSDIAAVRSGMKGMSIVATAYLFAMSLKLAKPFQRKPIAVVLCIAAAIASAYFHVHMGYVLLAGGSVAVALSKWGKL